MIVAIDKCGLSRDKQRVNTHNNQSHFLLSSLDNIAFLSVFVYVLMSVCLTRVSLKSIPDFSSRRKFVVTAGRTLSQQISPSL